jgi:UDP-GlcNAc:undecaprenyl-phosphate GlcNAc-1-phosphate transferase
MNLVIYLSVLVESLVLSMVLTPVAARVARRTGFYDHPEGRKVHVEPTPYLGGAAIFISFNVVILLNLLTVTLLGGPGDPGGNFLGKLIAAAAVHREGIGRVLPRLLGFLLGGLIVFVIGLVDDRKGMSPLLKLVGQFAAAGIFCVFLYFHGSRQFLFVTGSAWFIPPVILWLVVVMNSFNFIDNMDGLAGGVAAIAAFFFAAVSYLVGEQIFLVLAYLALLGATLGFLKYNRNPASIFMGDAGSMFLGYTLAGLAVLGDYAYPETRHYLVLLVPAVILSLPMFDTVTVIAIRLKRGRPIYIGDRNHFSHRLVDLGLNHRDAVLLIYLVVFCTGLGALILPLVEIPAALLILLQVVLIFTIILLLERAGAAKKDNFAPLVIFLLAVTVILSLVALHGIRT